MNKIKKIYNNVKILVSNILRDIYIWFLANPYLTHWVIYLSKAKKESDTVQQIYMQEAIKKMEKHDGVIRYLKKQLETEQKSLDVALSEKQKIQKEINFFRENLLQAEMELHKILSAEIIEASKYKDLMAERLKYKQQLKNSYITLSDVNEYIKSLEDSVETKKELLDKALKELEKAQKELAEEMAWAKIYNFPNKKGGSNESKKES